MDFNGYCYFRKPMAMMQQKEEIFCDDTSRLEMMQRIFYGRIIPLIAIFCCLIINGYMSTTEHGAHRLTIVFAVLMVLYMVIFLQFAVKYFFLPTEIKKNKISRYQINDFLISAWIPLWISASGSPSEKVTTRKPMSAYFLRSASNSSCEEKITVPEIIRRFVQKTHIFQ